MAKGKTIKTDKHSLRIEELSAEDIQRHVLDPESSPLSEKHKAQFERIKKAAELLDRFHPANVVVRMQQLYNVSSSTLKKDVALAQELFKSKYEFDWDYWFAWQVKDLVQVIDECRETGAVKERIAAHKALKEIIGDRPDQVADPNRMGHNQFYVQLNNNKTVVNVPISSMRNLSAEEVRAVTAEIISPVEDDADVQTLLFPEE